jgi:hypothetical protein
VATATGLFRVTGGDARSVEVREIPLGIVSLGTDPDGRLVGVALESGDAVTAVQMFAYDPHNDRVTLGATLRLGKPTIAVVGGTCGWAVRRRRHRHARPPRRELLGVAGTSPLDKRTGLGAVLWPGDYVM